MADYRNLAIRLIASNGKVAGSDIKTLKKALFAEEKPSHEAVEFLTDLRAALLKKHKKSSAKFDSFYLKSLQANILGNGGIDAQEVSRIGDVVLADQTLKTSAKRKFLDGLKKKADSVPPEFDGLYELIKKEK